MEPPKFVTADWLKEEVGKPDTKTRVLDATWHLPPWKRDAAAEHASCRVKGATFMDLRVVHDASSKLPNTAPSKEHFEKCMGDLGITSDTSVVVYDNNEQFGGFSAARAWLLFKMFGHRDVAILDGGLPAYLKSGGPTDSGPPTIPQPATYKAEDNKAKHLRDYDQMLANWKDKTAQVVDARPAGRFNGTAPEPNPNLPSGHMIGAYNVCFKDLFKPDTKTMKSPEEMKQVFQQAGVDFSKPVITMCTSGMVSSWIVACGLMCGWKDVPLYDNSWSQWVKEAPDEMKKVGVKGADMK
ncbi:thiosulfate sulfurtransferase-like [Dysidea avara]|uniref:thiosulfate sulfurtransferase-like n=1 Tax=Dysidea avara TaxID=196820 RepID=UPI003331D863